MKVQLLLGFGGACQERSGREGVGGEGPGTLGLFSLDGYQRQSPVAFSGQP